MNASGIKKLQHFVGKICTVITNNINKNDFSLEQFCNIFTCMIDSIDSDGISGIHPLTKCRNFFFLDKVVAIVEEQTIKEDHPEYKEILQEVKKSPLANNSPFIDPEIMANLANQAKMLQKSESSS